MAGMSRIEIIGNIGRDAEMRYSQEGTPRLSFSVAHSPRVKQGEQERTSWYRCTLTGKRAEALQQYLVKGKQVFVRGDFDVREYTNKDGNVATSLDVFVGEIELIGARVEGQQQEQSYQAPRQQAKQESAGGGWGDSDDIPFRW